MFSNPAFWWGCFCLYASIGKHNEDIKMDIQVTEAGLQDDCKGRYFRYTEAGFSGKNGRIVLTRELRPLKTISCSGCPECKGLDDELAQRANEKDFLQFSPSLISGDTVTLLQIPLRRDAERRLVQWYYEVTRADTT